MLSCTSLAGPDGDYIDGTSPSRISSSMTDAVDPPDRLKAKPRGRLMLKRMTVGILMILMMLAVGCGESGESLKETDGIALDRVFVAFTVPSGDSQVSELLDSLGSHIVETGFYNDRVQVSLPEHKTSAEMVEILKGNTLVRSAELYYLFDPDQVAVKFKVPHSDGRISDLLESLGSHIARTYEYSDFVLVAIPEDRTVAEMVECLSRNPLVEYAEPNYCFYTATPIHTLI
jgi:hypothetical protein